MAYAISVIMPVYKETEDWVRAAVESILAQTFSDFELILIIDQPGRFALEAMLQQYVEQDERLQLFTNEKNMGLPRTLNRGLSLAKGKYIARMDADDIAFPERLRRQFDFMEANQEVSLCGTQVIKIDERGRKIGRSHNETDFTLLKKVVPHINIVTHPTWLLRREVFQTIGDYRDMPGEDYDFVLRMVAAGLKITNIDKPLLYYRVRTDSYTQVLSLEQKIGFKYTQELYKERLQTGKDRLDKEALMRRVERAQRRYGEKQRRSQALLIKARRKGAAGKRWQKNMLILSSFLASPVQRRYYIDWAQAYMIRQLHPAHSRLHALLRPLRQRNKPFKNQ
ncbi:MAG: glycosyltransferase [Bacteroidota bacterium]